jgi:hypothetical protein
MVQHPQDGNLNVQYFENLKSHVLFIVSNAMPVRFERQTMTDGMPVCIMFSPASYDFVGVERSERVGTYSTERERERELFNDVVSC